MHRVSKLRSIPCVLVFAVGLLIWSAGTSSADTIFFESFQSYAAGSDLIGQGGWMGGSTGGSPAMYVGNGNYLASSGNIVLDGRNATGLNSIHYAGHALPGSLDPSMITVMSFDAWGTSTNPPSTNSGVGFGIGAPTNPAVVTPVYWDIQAPAGGWGLDVRALYGNYDDMTKRFVVPNSYDRAVRLSIVIDGPAGQVYGLYDLGSGVAETTRFAISPSQIASLDYVSLFIDYQGGIYQGASCTYGPPWDGACRLGPEIDNISVQTAVPEPASLLLLGTGLVGVRAWRKRRG